MSTVIRKILGLELNKDEIELMNALKDSYKSLRVVGRGTIKVDEEEIKEDKIFQEFYQKAEELVKEA